VPVSYVKCSISKNASAILQPRTSSYSIKLPGIVVIWTPFLRAFASTANFRADVPYIYRVAIAGTEARLNNGPKKNEKHMNTLPTMNPNRRCTPSLSSAAAAEERAGERRHPLLPAPNVFTFVGNFVVNFVERPEPPPSPAASLPPSLQSLLAQGSTVRFSPFFKAVQSISNQKISLS
jgi:hypothetical protein